MAQLSERELRVGVLLGLDHRAHGRAGPRRDGRGRRSCVRGGELRAHAPALGQRPRRLYLGWTWNTWGDCDNILITDYTGTPTANYGQAFKGLLAATKP